MPGDEPTTEALARLAGLVRKARLAAGMSVLDAAQKGDMSHVTWGRVEKGEPVRELTYTGIEQALGWEFGSVIQVLNGAGPGVLKAPHGTDSASANGVDVPVVHRPAELEATALAAIRVIEEVLKSNLPASMKMRLIQREVTEVRAEIATHSKRSEEEPRREAG